MDAVVVSTLVVGPGHGHPDAFLERLRELTKNRSVLIVACRRPLALLRQDFARAAIPTANIFILDVTTSATEGPNLDPEHEAFLFSPVLLETIAKRAQVIIRARAVRPATVVVDDVGSFADYAPREALLQLARYAIQQLSCSSDIEFHTTFGFANDPLVDHLRNLVDGEFSLFPTGDSRPHPTLMALA